jgi:hypothetical protein
MTDRGRTNESWFKPNHPDWAETNGFTSEEAAALGRLVNVSPATAQTYSRIHGVSEDLAAQHLVELLTYSAVAGRVYQHRELPQLRLEAPRRIGRYGVLLNLDSTRITRYRTTSISRTWIAVRNIQRNAKDDGTQQHQPPAPEESRRAPVAHTGLFLEPDERP